MDCQSYIFNGFLAAPTLWRKKVMIIILAVGLPVLFEIRRGRQYLPTSGTFKAVRVPHFVHGFYVVLSKKNHFN